MPIADWPCLVQDDLNGVGANVSIFATITLVILSALNPALWALIAPEVPKAAPEQKENTVRWSCTRRSPPLRATVGPA